MNTEKQYRTLIEGEVIEIGDEYLREYAHFTPIWVPVNTVFIGYKVNAKTRKIRRPIEPNTNQGLDK